ncbi:MAG: hypothetical protein EU548_07560, partial [Promethearchaeota archaeon]
MDKTFSTTGLLLGVIGLILGLISILEVFPSFTFYMSIGAIVFGILGIIFGAIGFAREDPKALGIAGLIL